MKNYKITLYISLILSISIGIFMYDYCFYRQIPEVIYLKNDEMAKFEFSLPVTGEIEKDDMVIETFDNTSGSIDDFSLLHSKVDNTIFSQNLTTDDVMNGHSAGNINVYSNHTNDYVWKLKLFGFFPLKDVKLEVVKDQYVYPVGSPVGIYVKSEGVLVAGLGNVETTPTTEECPCKHILQAGDYIQAINGEKVNLKSEVMNMVKASAGNNLILTIKRNGELSQVEVHPIVNLEGEYQIGVWIRDSAQGIGTLTYIDENGGFGALGHGINDIDTSELLNIDYGGLYETEIVSVKKGTTGEPGEIAGIIRFIDTKKIGAIEENTSIGIYGHAIDDETVIDCASLNKYPVALKQEIELGTAQILFSDEEGLDTYDIEIENIDYSQGDGNRGLVIKVTDDDLIKKTGGIIQGMSGSPIIQNGKFIGAVTHVFVNDPTKGYGIFAETMLQ